jgi:hypothetical protein
MSSYTAEMVHGLNRADAPSPRHPKPRWQVRYQEGKHERSAGIFQTPKAAERARNRVERGLPPTLEHVAPEFETALTSRVRIEQARAC